MQLASGSHIPDGLLAANALLSEKLHQGFAAPKSTLHQGFSVSISSTPLGIIGPLYDAGTGSRYTGKERDAESGNDYFGARYYGSSMGRWMSPDWSAQAEPVPYSVLGDPQSLNLYQFVRNNPLRNRDSDGHDCPPDCGDGLNDSMAGTPFEGHGLQLIQGTLELTGAAFGATEVYAAAQVAATVGPGLQVGIGALAVTGASVNGVTNIVGSATGTKTDEGTSAVSAVTNPVNTVASLATGSMTKGSQVADAVTVGKAVVATATGKGSNPGEVGAALQGAKQAVSNAIGYVKTMVSPPPPPAPPPPPPPPCATGGGCNH
jgi:RHS repeat-associated protein